MFSFSSHIPKILVVGDLMMDHYIWGVCERVSPEAPVTIVEVQKESYQLGGACNVVHNLLALGAEVFACGVIGDDKIGCDIQEKFEELGVDTRGIVIQKGRLSTKKSRIIASNQQVLRVDWEQRQDISHDTQEALLCFVEQILPVVDIVILSDYAKGVLTKDITPKIIHRVKETHKFILVDPKGHDYSKYDHATLLTPNKKEAYEATGIKIVDDESLKASLHILKQKCHLTYPLITLSEDGIGLLCDESLKKIPTISKEVYDVTGAGDTVISSLAFALAHGIPIQKAAEFANAAAAVVVSKIGSATASLQEIQCYSQQTTYQKMIALDDLDGLIQALKKEHKKIVWTNGCFDILHCGHTKYLQASKALGDVLIVGVNSDQSIKNLKGVHRPINTLSDRMDVLSALAAVDYIVPFDDLTPYHVIKKVQPDILVKGADYMGKEIVGSEFAQEVVLLPYEEGKSSTQIIDKIRSF